MAGDRMGAKMAVFFGDTLPAIYLSVLSTVSRS